MNNTFSSFEKSLERFEEVLKEEKTIIHRDAAIQRFEFTTELAWKCIQRFLREQKIVCRSPKECLKEAFKFDLVEDDPKWMEALDDRNLTVHTYDEKTADEVYNRLSGYLDILNQLKDKLKKSIH